MLFTILVAILIVLTIGVATATYYASDYDDAGNSAGAFIFTLIFGGILIVLVPMLGASSAAKDDPKNHVVVTEKTYTLAENSIPEYEDGELEFAYVENGQVFPYEEAVDAFSVGMDKPKAFKITEYDVVDKGIASWPVNGGTKVEVIK